MSAQVFNEFVSKLSLALNFNQPIVRDSEPVTESTTGELNGGVDAIKAVEDIFKGGDIDPNAEEPIEDEQNVQPEEELNGGGIYEDESPKIEDTPIAKPAEEEAQEAQEEEEEQDEKNKIEIDDGVIDNPNENEESHSKDDEEIVIDQSNDLIMEDASSGDDVTMTNSDDGSSEGDDVFKTVMESVRQFRISHSKDNLTGGGEMPKGIVEMHGGAMNVKPQSRQLTLINEYPWILKK